MIFNEIYGVYYHTVARILKIAALRPVSERELRQITERCAFSESVLSIVPALREGRWQLLTAEGRTPLRHAPSMPLTLLQKRWLKAILADPRARLFDIEEEGLEDVEPLFTPRDYYIFDQYGDGDRYTDEGYIQRFRMILTAIEKGAWLELEIISRKGSGRRLHVMPKCLEYSEKDDKFRLIGADGTIVNLGRICSCRYWDGKRPDRTEEKRKRCVILELVDERRALDRVMLHFAHFEKLAERTGEKTYRLTVYYDENDETEMVIRVLSFGPFVRALEPEDFAGLIKDRLRKQKSCGL